MSLADQVENRKGRLQSLKSQKRKRDDLIEQSSKSLAKDDSTQIQFRNYDPDSKAPLLGFLHDPAAGLLTVEHRAKDLERTLLKSSDSDSSIKHLQVEELQPKQSDWDLKRDLQMKLERVRAKQRVVVAKILRERILKSE